MRAAQAARDGYSNALVPSRRSSAKGGLFFADGRGQRQRTANAAPAERRARKIQFEHQGREGVVLGADGEPLGPLKNQAAAPSLAEAVSMPAAGALAKGSDARRQGKRVHRMSDPNPLSALLGHPDPKDAAARDKRLFLNHEREHRVTDPKVRTVGIDVQVLDRQVEELQAMGHLEADAEDFWAKQAVQQDKHAVALEHEVAEARRHGQADVEAYRRRYQRKHMAKEWDLNDPAALRKELPPRVGDEDPRCGPASMLRFEGEDLAFRTRRKQQQAQVRRWRDQHLEEEAVLAGRHDTAGILEDQRNGELFDRLGQLEALQRQQRSAAAQSNAMFNRAFAAQQRQRRDAEAQRTAVLDQAEIDFNLGSALLNEFDTSRHGGRSKAKGLSEEEIASIHNQQAQQREQLRAAKIAEAENAAIAAAREGQENRMAINLDQQLTEERRAEQVHTCRQNEIQKRMQLEKDQQRRRLYATEVGEQYFSNFSLVPQR